MNGLLVLVYIIGSAALAGGATAALTRRKPLHGATLAGLLLAASFGLYYIGSVIWPTPDSLTLRLYALLFVGPAALGALGGLLFTLLRNALRPTPRDPS